MVTLYQSVVASSPDPKAAQLYVYLRGVPEYPGPPMNQKANWGEFYFVDDGVLVPEPDWTENACGNPGLNRIRIVFHRWQYPHLVQILQGCKGIRCFFYKLAGKPAVAGLKDWNEKVPLQIPDPGGEVEYI